MSLPSTRHDAMRLATVADHRPRRAPCDALPGSGQVRAAARCALDRPPREAAGDHSYVLLLSADRPGHLETASREMPAYGDRGDANQLRDLLDAGAFELVHDHHGAPA